MASPYYSFKRTRKLPKSKLYNLEANEPQPNVVESKKIMLKASPETVIRAERWLQVTFKSAGSNVSIGTKSGEVAAGNGFPVGDVVSIIVSPGSQIYASGDDGSYLNVIVQPLRG